jgi:Methylmalonyl-CoA mutase
VRSTEEEKQSQLQRLQDFHTRHAHAAPAMLQRLQQAVMADQNVFEVLMEAVRWCSLGQITHALFEVGGSTGGVCEAYAAPRTVAWRPCGMNCLKSASSVSSFRPPAMAKAAR